MDDFPTKVADLLESIATRVRSMTVDRVAGWTKWAALGIVLAALGFLLIVFLLVGLFRLFGEVVGVTLAYAIIGGLFVIAGALLWSRRHVGGTSKEV